MPSTDPIDPQRSDNSIDVSAINDDAERDIPFAMEGIIYFHNPAAIQIRDLIKTLTQHISDKSRSVCSRLTS
jgi:hypothetical protein